MEEAKARQSGRKSPRATVLGTLQDAVALLSVRLSLYLLTMYSKQSLRQVTPREKQPAGSVSSMVCVVKP